MKVISAWDFTKLCHSERSEESYTCDWFDNIYGKYSIYTRSIGAGPVTFVATKVTKNAVSANGFFALAGRTGGARALSAQ